MVREGVWDCIYTSSLKEAVVQAWALPGSHVQCSTADCFPGLFWLCQHSSGQCPGKVWGMMQITDYFLLPVWINGWGSFDCVGESCALLLALKALGQALARYMSDYKGSRGFNHRSDLSAGTESHILTLYLLQVPRTVRVPAQHLAFFFQQIQSMSDIFFFMSTTFYLSKSSDVGIPRRCYRHKNAWRIQNDCSSLAGDDLLGELYWFVKVRHLMNSRHQIGDVHRNDLLWAHRFLGTQNTLWVFKSHCGHRYRQWFLTLNLWGFFFKIKNCATKWRHPTCLSCSFLRSYVRRLQLQP